MIVDLNQEDFELAQQYAVKRHTEALKRGKKDKHGLKGDPIKIHLQGTISELAAAKAFRAGRQLTVNTFKKGGDLPGIQIRGRSKFWYELLIRQSDNLKYPYVLVTPPANEPVLDVDKGGPLQLELRGWLMGYEVKEEWLQPHGGREEAYFVPSHELKPIHILIQMWQTHWLGME
jgi:hypothetical protein